MIIAFAHYKGGTGKTTSCLSIAGYLARFGKKVLVVDLDPQGNATSGLGIDKSTLNRTMYDAMKDKTGKMMKEIAVETQISNIHLAPANQQLERIELKAYKKKEDAKILIKCLDKIKKHYDFILIDTPPVHSHFIINGMAAADKVFAVLDPGIFALEGLETLKESFGEFFEKLNLELNIESAIITKTPKISIFSLFRKNYTKEIKQDVEKLLDKPVFLIPYSDDIYYTHKEGMPISHYKPQSKVGKAYQKIAIGLLRDLKRSQKIAERTEFY